jgi:hypothetical protein
VRLGILVLLIDVTGVNVAPPIIATAEKGQSHHRL